MTTNFPKRCPMQSVYFENPSPKEQPQFFFFPIKSEGKTTSLPQSQTHLYCSIGFPCLLVNCSIGVIFPYFLPKMIFLFKRFTHPQLFDFPFRKSEIRIGRVVPHSH